MRGRLAPYSLLLAIVAICIVLSLLNQRFLNASNLINVARQISINGVLAIGVTWVLLTSGVDLSLGSVLALGGMVLAYVASMESMPWPVPIGCAILAGMGCGLANGAIVTFGRVAPFIATLGMMVVARGMSLLITGGPPVRIENKPLLSIGEASLWGIPYPVLILLGVAGISYVCLRHMRVGRYIYAVGGSERAANASGVNVRATKLIAYSVCGACAALAGLILAARTTSGSPTAGVGYELDAITAAVIGGTRLSGGVGGVGGTLLGALLIGLINNGQEMLDVSPYYKDIIKGCIIIAAVLLDRRSGTGYAS